MKRTLIIVVVALVVLGGGYLLFTPAPAPAPESQPPVAPAAPVAKRAPEAPAAAPAPSPASSGRKAHADVAPAAAAPAAAPTPAAPAPEAAPEGGTLRIDADVAGAQVFIDRQYVGTTPAVANNVKPGTHQLNVSVEGYDGIAQTLDVEPGPRDIKVRFKEVRLDLKIAVVHKHRMGSCQGRLVASPQGIRYETDNKDDAFTATMADLEQFQVDYLEKNLKVKVKKGKQYNFTDPDGNADRLFVFHRDVEKARDRLKKGDAAGQ